MPSLVAAAGRGFPAPIFSGFGRSSGGRSSSSDLSHSSSSLYILSISSSFFLWASSRVLRVKAGELFKSGEYTSCCVDDDGRSGGCSLVGVVGYGGLACRERCWHEA